MVNKLTVSCSSDEGNWVNCRMQNVKLSPQISNVPQQSIIARFSQLELPGVQSNMEQYSLVFDKYKVQFTISHKTGQAKVQYFIQYSFCGYLSSTMTQHLAMRILISHFFELCHLKFMFC